MSLVPYANKHIQKYAPADLDATTLRHLRDECTGWLKSHFAIEAEFTNPVGLAEWQEIFKQDVADTRETLAKVEAELKSRNLS